MKTQLKDNIFIEGYNKKDLGALIAIELEDFGYNIIYNGKTSEIPEEIAKGCADFHPNIHYKDYSIEGYKKVKDWTDNWTKLTAKESIQSACNQTYCIIYKEK